MENWYSILRNGLRNLSNTSLMTAGAAYGQGIYASSQYGTSYGYTARYTNGKSMWKECVDVLTNGFCIGIVEIINRPVYMKSGDNIVVVPEENEIILRYLLVLKNFQYPHVGITSTQLKLDEHYSRNVKALNEQMAAERS